MLCYRVVKFRLFIFAFYGAKKSAYLSVYFFFFTALQMISETFRNTTNNSEEFAVVPVVREEGTVINAYLSLPKI